jgi:hypothetical protein
MSYDSLQMKYDPDAFRYHPMYHTWCMDMKSAFIHAFKNHPNYTDNYINNVRTIQECPDFVIGYTFGDEEFSERWKAISKCLAELYIKVRWMFARYGCEPHMVELYREKYEQALDWLTGDATEIPPLIKCGLTKQISNDQITVIANNILRKRAQWLDRINQIEHIRIAAKKEIIQGTECGSIRTIMLNAIDLLTKLDNKWCSEL